MARRGKYDPYGFPGLFDTMESTQGTAGTRGIPSTAELLSGGMRAHAPSPIANPLGAVVARPVPGKILFISAGSGSSGNCAYIGDSAGGVLIDAGVAADTTVDTLAHAGIRPEKVHGILLTHDHSDHMRYAYALLRKWKHMKLYCTPRTLNGILRRHSVSRRIKEYHMPVYKEIPFTVGNFTVTPFEVMHDGSDNVGFSLRHDDRNFVVATDLGCISERADHYMRQADYLVIESNYDEYMLRFGPYPEYLKARIRACNGHLDNKVTAEYLARIASPRLKYVFLCHLSLDNNTPDTALTTVRNALAEAAITTGSGVGTPDDLKAHLQLTVLPRFEASPLYILRP